MAFGDESFDHRDLLRDVLDGAGFDVGWEQVEEFAIVMEAPGPAGGEVVQGLAGVEGIADGFVIHISDVADVEGFGATGFESAAQHILEDEGTEVSDVRGAIDGGPAAVEAESGTIQRGEFPLAAGEGVEQAHADGVIGALAFRAKSEAGNFRFLKSVMCAIRLGSTVFAGRIAVPMVPPVTDSRVRQIVSGVALLVGIMVVVCSLLLGWRYLPGVLGEWVGTMVGLATTPFLLEATFVVFGFCVVFWLNHRSEKKEGSEWVYLEQVVDADLPGHAQWAVLPVDAPNGEEPGLLDQAEGAADVGDWEELVGLLAKMEESELKQSRVLLLRERLARATGRVELAEELAEERKATDHHA